MKYWLLVLGLLSGVCLAGCDDDDVEDVIEEIED